MPPPVVSILTTAYNAEPWLDEAIRSAFAQEGAPPFELVLVDDGSTDATWAIMEKWRREPPPPGVPIEVKTRRLPGNAGRARALRAARGIAEGEFLAWLDADDMLAPKALRICAERLAADPGLGFVSSRCWAMSADGKRSIPWKRGDCELTLRQLEKGNAAHHFRMCRASVYDKAGGPDPEFVAAVDYDLCLRMAGLAGFARVPLRLYHWRQRPGSMSKRHPKEQEAFMKLAQVRHAKRQRAFAAGQQRQEGGKAKVD